ncbi:MAG: type II secretion system protein [Sulfurimonas sp.]|uniref:pilus assembly FimT family protein n=1 Tax=Sulfurimonas sp. TaxID=2022749 RepID=UPI0026324633|nr:type II secretion system protein [Sulfurimonas sp.]MDD2653473.1 type II secretion system protein [Sulfurimonas sp.]MDD3452592.1 type II secretion system protein [Sulfurimonas sp.]
MKKAFTMIELIFVIVVIGILAAVIMPRTGSNKLQEAATQVLSHIRYAQHLAIVDDKFDPNDTNFKANPGYDATNDGKWYKEFWRIRFYTSNSSEIHYAVFTDKDREGNIDTSTHTEPALDALSGKYLYIGDIAGDLKNNEKMDLTKNYQINSINTTCDTVGWREIFFDNLGRPYAASVSTGTNPPYSNLLTANCDITMTSPEGNVTIRVHPETGYSCILNSAGTDCI